MAKKIGGGSGYLKRNSELYGHEDGRHRNGDRPRCRGAEIFIYEDDRRTNENRLCWKKLCTSRQEVLLER